MTTVRDIAQYLEDNSIGTYATDIFIGQEPPNPDACITIYEYPGSAPDLRAGLEYPNIQIRVRATEYTDARERLQTIQDLLQEIGNEDSDDASTAYGATINGTFYAAIRALQGPTSLGEDGNYRMRLTQNFAIKKGRI